MVSVLAIGPKVRGLKTSRGDILLRAIKTRRTPSFGGEVKRSTPCCKILRHVKNNFGVLKKDASKVKFVISFSKFLLICF
jgi:hypothetical protein